MSNLAYDAGTGKTNAEAAKAVSKSIEKMKGEAMKVIANRMRLSNAEVANAKKTLEFLKTLKVEAATLDAIAIRSTVAGKSELLFGFRGTAKVRDLVPDMQLAFNKKSIRRLDEAKAFVDKVMKAGRFKPTQVTSYGHSLGGFIAEGVRNSFTGSRAVTMNAGVPRFNYKKGVVKAWGVGGERAGKSKYAIRFFTRGDVVSANGLKVGNLGASHWMEKKSRWNLLKNHQLSGVMTPLRDFKKVEPAMRSFRKTLALHARKQAVLARRTARAAKKKAAKAAAASKKGAKLVGKALGKAMFGLSAAHVGIESAKDWHKLQDLAKKEGKIDHDLVMNMVYAPSDILLGRGTTKSIVNGVKKGWKSTSSSCKKGQAECLQHFKNATVAAGKMLGKGYDVVKKGLGNCKKDVKECGKKVASVVPAIGNAIVDYTRKSAEWLAERHYQADKRKRFCATRQKQCEAEDKKAEENSAKAWQKYRNEYKAAAVAYAPIGAAKSLWKKLKNLTK
jgi:hypothetical protein